MPLLRTTSMHSALRRDRRRHDAVMIVCAILLTACGADAPVAPRNAETSPASPHSGVAFAALINVRTRSVTVTPPARRGPAGATPSIAGRDAPSLSLLGSDVIGLVASNVRISPVGAYAPNKVRVTFDLGIEIRLPTLALTVPTWPVPPAPEVILFPIAYATTVAPGNAAGGNGNVVEVTQPSLGTVSPSPDWNGTGAPGSGSPYNFFTSAPCTAEASADCFRWITFGSRLEPGRTRDTRTVGFDMDASVQQFRTRMIVAADLAPAAVKP